jgi:hypothetical protein
MASGADTLMNAVPDCGSSSREAALTAALALALLADSRAWVAAQPPQFGRVPVEAMAISGAAVGPWRAPGEVIPCMRMYLWIFAFDDCVETFAPDDAARLDDLLRRCAGVVRGGRDDSHWLLTTLSDLQADLAAWPHYPALADLWIEKFDAMLDSMRWGWEVALGRRTDDVGLQDYLAHADSISACTTVMPRWITYGGDGLLDHLEVLVAALAEYVIANRLANDLASYARELDQPGSDNVLDYGVSTEWVKAEIARRVRAVHWLLDGLVAQGFGPAIELVRETEYATTFYTMAEFRGWGSDASG